MAGLSIVVLTRNEEHHLPALLDSVRGVGDELLVVDSGSTDRTVELAQAAGARVVHRDWVDYGTQRLFAVAEARHPWILSLDADERLSPELAEAVRRELSRPEGERAAAYRLHFRHRLFGSRLRFGAMWRDKRIRLFDRRRGNYDGSPVHERVVVDGPVRLLAGRCDHEGSATVAEMEGKLTRYARAQARLRFARGERFRPWHWLRWPAGFAKRYLLRLGVLDGPAGFRAAVLYAGYDLEKTRHLRVLEAEGHAGPSR